MPQTFQVYQWDPEKQQYTVLLEHFTHLEDAIQELCFYLLVHDLDSIPQYSDYWHQVIETIFKFKLLPPTRKMELLHAAQQNLRFFVKKYTKPVVGAYRRLLVPCQGGLSVKQMERHHCYLHRQQRYYIGSVLPPASMVSEPRVSAASVDASTDALPSQSGQCECQLCHAKTLTHRQCRNMAKVGDLCMVHYKLHKKHGFKN
uniref:Uncharacterized protein n=1 Tax=viral metagenome TaxID=1070528 RepID=A0A6C0BM54_9ZZZZ